MSLRLGQVVPDFKAETDQGTISFHEWLGDSWAIFFSHPADFTPVCTTELGKAEELRAEFEKRKVKMIALSCDNADSHRKFIVDIKAFNKLEEFGIPIIADENRTVANLYGMMDPDEKDSKGIPLTCRSVFVIGPGKKLKLSILYPATTGRNFHEILRVIDSLQLTASKKVATPADWQVGDRCMVVPSLSDAEAKSLFPAGFEAHAVPSGKNYIRTTPQPQ